MKKASKKNKTGTAPKVDPYLEGLVAKLIDRLVSLEKKMDTVVAQTAAKPSGNGGVSKPFQNLEANKPPRRDRVLYEAVCADCHKVCEVPFKPSEDRAVYCKECFARRKSQPAGRQGGGSGKGPLGLTPVALPPKPVGKLGLPVPSLAPSRETSQKTKKTKLAKKAKKKK